MLRDFVVGERLRVGWDVKDGDALRIVRSLWRALWKRSYDGDDCVPTVGWQFGEFYLDAVLVVHI